MEYSFSGLKTSKIYCKNNATERFIYFFNLKKQYRTFQMLEPEALPSFLQHESYLLMNNHPRYKGRRVFYTGNAVEAKKEDVLDFIYQSIITSQLIIPLFIVPLSSRLLPSYMLLTQEDPIFEVMVLPEP